MIFNKILSILSIILLIEGQMQSPYCQTQIAFVPRHLISVSPKKLTTKSAHAVSKASPSPFSPASTRTVVPGGGS